MLPLELVVWYGTDGAVEGFQLCYDFGSGEHALTWRPTVGFAHSTVDSGSDGPFSNRTPILVPDGAVPWAELARRFTGSSATLEPSLRELVGNQLQAQR